MLAITDHAANASPSQKPRLSVIQNFNWKNISRDDSSGKCWIQSVRRPACGPDDIGGEDASRGCRVLMSILGLVPYLLGKKRQAVATLHSLQQPPPRACATPSDSSYTRHPAAFLSVTTPARLLAPFVLPSSDNECNLLQSNYSNSNNHLL
ncbi:hypothetical protein GGP41_003750 [Bipolaris sorokiniana]|uniref:Uncharacterized protein n=1 Tax=Cochliobolus sativus TaxID=45130 RepID=A0A8H5ZA01_COCSA|nr:hypothetical protein GGP41_003750 [Bipolaris sorokiniana]